MALIEILKPKTAQSLSTRVVVGLTICLGVGCLALIWATMNALWKAGHPLLALLIVTPLGTGLGHYCVNTIRYCRPGWFKPEPAKEPE